MENPTNYFLKEAKFASVQESQIKNKTVMSWNL